ncbi:MAG: peptidoglycan DD-metalloendopeptidase family protein [Bacillota bacterium]
MEDKFNFKKNLYIIFLSFVFIGIVIAIYTSDFENNDSLETEIIKEDISEEEVVENSNESESTVAFQESDRVDSLELKTEDFKLDSNEVTYPVAPAISENDKNKIIDIKKPSTGNFVENSAWFYHPIYEDWRYQNGVVLKNGADKTIKAAASGEVLSVEHDPYYNLKIIIEHKEGWQTSYAKLKQTTLTEGEKISQGEVIGKTGDENLYFELIKNGNSLAPEEYINYLK